MSCKPDYQISNQLPPVALEIRFTHMNFPIVAAHESVCGPFLPIGDVRFDGEFRRDSGLVVLTSSSSHFDPSATWRKKDFFEN